MAVAVGLGVSCDAPRLHSEATRPPESASQALDYGNDPFIILADSLADSLAPQARRVAKASVASDVVELPREYLATDALPVAGRTVRVPAGADLQAALDAAQPGDELVLDAGATYTGTLILRKKSGAGWITLRSSGTLPAAGTRVTPSAAPQLARLVAASAAQPVIKTEAGAHHYRLIGLEVTATPGATMAYTLVSLGDASSAQNTIEKQPHHLVLDRVYVHGTPTLNFQRCIALNSAATAIIDSWLSECHGKGMDSQAIAGWNGTGPYKIVNNRLEGAGENVMFGGADPHIPNALPRDIEIRGNHFYKPPEWKGVWSVKNLLELKIGQRVLVEGNVFENCWRDAQTGFAMNFKSTNQSGRAPWSETSDVTVRDNVISNTANGVSFSARPESNPAVPAARFRFANNVFERIGTGDYPGGRLFQIGGIDDLQIEHNTAVSSHSAMILTQGWPPMQRFIVRDNVFAGSRYGIMGDGAGSGSAALTTRAAPGWQFSGNVLSGVRGRDYPPGNSFPKSVDLSRLRSLERAGRESSGGDGPARRVVPARSGAPDEGRAPEASGPGADLARLKEAIAGVVVTP